MPLGSESVRVVVAGAASLRGKDLKLWLEEGGFPAGEIRLVDEELAAGTLTEVGGEPAVIQPVDESTFERMRFVFFAGSPGFAARYGAAAERAGATVIDLTGGLAASSGARPWIPHLDALLAPPPSVSRTANKSEARTSVALCLSPSAPAIVACSLAAALRDFSPRRLAIIFFHPVSERGQSGIEELEGQTRNLLTLQPLPQEVFDTQVAFNLLDRWGPASSERLSGVRAAIAREVNTYLAGRIPPPAMTLVHAPVFYGHAFAAYAEFPATPDANLDPKLFAPRLEAAGFALAAPEDPAPSNVAAAGETRPMIGHAERDENVQGGYWFWGAADNMRVATANAVRIAERLLAS